MRTIKIYLILFFIMLLLVPYLVVTLFSPKEASEQNDNEFPEITVYRTEKDAVESVDCYEYICNTVAGEMQSNSNAEALKAQAIACYTYMLTRAHYVKNNPDADIGHKGAYVCDDSAHCMAYLEKSEAKSKWGDSFFDKNYPNIETAVKDVLGLAITYQKQPINAVFHSMSSGNTQSAKEVWGTDVPYLQSVACEFDLESDDCKSEKAFSVNEFSDILNEELGVKLTAPPDCWIGEIIKTSSGLVSQITIGDTVYSGVHIRNIFGLKSACFDVRAEDGKINFTVYGYGHGVGLSQNGANALADKGYKYEEILKYFYNGTEIEYQKL